MKTSLPKGWISIKEELPTDLNIDYLCICVEKHEYWDTIKEVGDKKELQRRTRKFACMKVISGGDFEDNDQITHWRSLPEFPVEEIEK